MTEISMPPNPSLWRRATAAYAKLLEILLAACVGILVIPVTLQIISRYTPFIPSYIWTEEMARFMFVWTIMIGAMVGIRESQHFEVDVWPDLSRRSEAMVRILARLGVLAMAVVFVWGGLEFTRFAWNHLEETPEFDLKPESFFKSPLASINLSADRAEIVYGNERHGVGFALQKERGEFKVDDVTFVTGPGDDQKIPLKRTIRRQLAQGDAR
jgi:TRAP-type C4-dicarboxylate transport system permease small subunit